ncbi:MAG: hypothetical protein NW216_04810 [Hyphomicrobium sp.]|nr:hypothetical protein [Hyphomicrobium sp.]
MPLFPDNSTIHGARRFLALAVMLGATASTASAGGPSIGQFELKTLESAPGYMEFQSQNAWSFGQPDRESALVDGEQLYDENSVIKQRHALELEMGFTSFLKMRVGIEYERERLEEPLTLADAEDFGPLKLDELGAEVIGIFIPREGDGFGLGAVVEVERPLEREEQMSVVMGPIFEYASGPWFVAALPLLVHNFGGQPDDDGIKDNKWDFAYAAQLAYTLNEEWMFAIEAYGTVERVGNSGDRGEAALAFGDHDQHRIGPIVYYTYDLGRDLVVQPNSANDGEEEASELTVGLGLLAGLNADTPDATLKMSV